LPFTDRDGYRKRVDALFRIHLFSPEELAGELNKAVEGALTDVAEIENELAVDLRQQISGTFLAPNQRDKAIAEFRGALDQLVRAGQWDGTKDLGNLAASEAAAIIGTQVVARIGVQSGMLAAGAATSWSTFGVSLVIGVLADLTWTWIDDPKADVERDVLRATTKIATDGMNGLNAEFARVLARRATLWRETLKPRHSPPIVLAK
jgi:hypothetical protein